MTIRNTASERTFYLAMLLAVATAIVVGFAKSVFLRPLYPEVHAPHEVYFYAFHGAGVFAWFVLFGMQIALVRAHRTPLHRQLGHIAFVLVPLLLASSIYGAYLAYTRPGGFIDVPADAQLSVFGLLVSIALVFACFSGLALFLRRRSPSHKRLMLIASLALMEGAVTRWPLAIVASGGLTVSGRVTALFLLPMFAWDYWSTRRIQPATLWGVSAYVVYVLTRDALFGHGPFLTVLALLLGTPTHA